MVRDYSYKTEKAQMEMDARNEEIRVRDKKGNVIKWYESNTNDDKFCVGSPELNDESSGKPIYITSEGQSSEAEAPNPNNGIQNTESKETFDSSKMTEEELQTANEIYERLMKEAAADEAARQAEIEAIKLQQEQSEKDFNATTGSYSGQYGKKPMSEAENDAFLEIMNRNNSSNKTFEELASENQEN